MVSRSMLLEIQVGLLVQVESGRTRLQRVVVSRLVVQQRTRYLFSTPLNKELDKPMSRFDLLSQAVQQQSHQHVPGIAVG